MQMGWWCWNFNPGPWMPKLSFCSLQAQTTSSLLLPCTGHRSLGRANLFCRKKSQLLFQERPPQAGEWKQPLTFWAVNLAGLPQETANKGHFLNQPPALIGQTPFSLCGPPALYSSPFRKHHGATEGALNSGA